MNTQPNNIVLYPSSVLTEVARDVTPEEITSGAIATLAERMKELMYNANGVGLAAPQIGESIRMTVIDPQDDSGTGVLVLVNPVITSSSRLSTVAEEGCLSLPRVFGRIQRKRTVTVDYLDEHGEKNTLRAYPFLARVIQHELDHLDGVLFISKLAGPLNDPEEHLAAWDRGERPLLSVPYPYTYL